MKKLLPVLFILCACGSADSDRTHASVADAIKNSLGDPASYEPMEWGDVQPLYLDRKNAPATIALQDSVAYLKRIDDSLTQEYIKTRQIVTRQSLRDSINQLQLRLIHESSGQDTTQLIGYTISHRFKAKKSGGGVGVYSEVFGLNLQKDSAYALK